MSKWKEAREAEAKAQEQAEKQEGNSLDEFEKGMQDDMEALYQAFRDRAEKEEKRFQDVCDSNYYFVVCFSNNTQLVEFCDSVGLNSQEIYIDGREFAKKIGRALKTKDTQFPKVHGFGKDYVDRAREK